MDILEDKVICQLIQSLKVRLRKKTISSREQPFLSAPRLIFVCGKEWVDNEETIRNYTIRTLRKCRIANHYGTQNEAVLCIIAEKLYVQDLSEDIFSFEKMLAEISDRIIIVAESPGTFCELGAFVMDEDCRRKTMVINEDNADYENSFITKGPIKKLESLNESSIIRHNGPERIKNSHEYNFKVQEIAKAPLTIAINDNAGSVELKSLIYELANIVELFQPVEYFEIETLYKRLKDFEGYTIKNTADHKIRSIRQVLSLMEKMDMLLRQDGYYILNKNISCYNVMFRISRKEFNDFRIMYLNRLNKCRKSRVNVL